MRGEASITPPLSQLTCVSVHGLRQGRHCHSLMNFHFLFLHFSFDFLDVALFVLTFDLLKDDVNLS